jgi:hypothetical protein
MALSNTTSITIVKCILEHHMWNCLSSREKHHGLGYWNVKMYLIWWRFPLQTE